MIRRCSATTIPSAFIIVIVINEDWVAAAVAYKCYAPSSFCGTNVPIIRNADKIVLTASIRHSSAKRQLFYAFFFSRKKYSQ